MEEVLQQLKEFRDSIVLPERDYSPRDLFDDSPDPNEAHTYAMVLDDYIKALEKIIDYKPDDPKLLELMQRALPMYSMPLTEDNWIYTVKKVWDDPRSPLRSLVIIVNNTL